MQILILIQFHRTTPNDIISDKYFRVIGETCKLRLDEMFCDSIDWIQLNVCGFEATITIVFET